MTDVHEVRAVVTAYQRATALLPSTQYPSGIQDDLNSFLCRCTDFCQEISGHSDPGRWARTIIGPVLAAGMGATVDLRETRGAMGVLRAFGLAGERRLFDHEAWLTVRPYAHEQVLSAETIADVTRRTGLRLTRLPPNPGPADLLEELTRPRCLSFVLQMTRWLGEHFRPRGGCGCHDHFSQAYHQRRVELGRMNEALELAPITGARVLTGHRMTRSDWVHMLAGRVPDHRLDESASLSVTKEFLLEYWQRCTGAHKKPVENPRNGIDSTQNWV